ncbi:MAG: SusD/RagB family nutrient-binding outer membrane lipoprotein [Bacteroidota bacterium]|nr:SusD/RagB family nutrient-binding outer membrane lipoprotein [Bacteroidota bacterium]MDP4254710.1 SusD/RagB family nutrient-binding outer membrane lipoprotein [Bacteroidota bacterium]MDP4256841.1 SusD/RagB family nutrient-binding outer membrane lipoprotein [Bacteroidota bacterium]
MKRINNHLLKVILAGIILTGCNKNYLNVNNDPNRVTDANVTAELIFPQAEATVGNRAASANFLFLDHWIGYFAQNGTFAPQQNEITYNIDFSFGNTLFINHFDVLFDLHQCQVKGLAGGDTALAGASMVLAAKLWQELVDLYGDIPYSQTFQVATITSPAYDKAQDIYNDLQKKLDTAITYLSGSVPNKFAAADIIAHGNTNEWILLANTLKLRLLIRQSEISGFNPSADIAKILAKGGVLMAGQSVSVNPGYSNQAGKQNPFYANFGFTPTGVQSTTADDANAYIVKLEKTDNDPRLSRFFYPVGFAGSNFVGDVFGDLQSNIPVGSASSYFGPGLIGDPGGSGDVTAGPGSSQDQWIVPSFESMFWYAEAVARGWIPGNAQTAYAAAVTENFVWLGVPNAAAAATSYMSGAADADPNTLAGLGTPFLKDQFIAYQKYRALVGIDPLEAYSDIRRLNILTDNSYISAAPGKLSNSIPVRLLYPQSEYTSNSTNVLKEGTISPFTSKIFWDTN